MQTGHEYWKTIFFFCSLLFARFVVERSEEYFVDYAKRELCHRRIFSTESDIKALISMAGKSFNPFLKQSILKRRNTKKTKKDQQKMPLIYGNVAHNCQLTRILKSKRPSASEKNGLVATVHFDPINKAGRSRRMKWWLLGRKNRLLSVAVHKNLASNRMVTLYHRR